MAYIAGSPGPASAPRPARRSRARPGAGRSAQRRSLRVVAVANFDMSWARAPPPPQAAAKVAAAQGDGIEALVEASRAAGLADPRVQDAVSGVTSITGEGAIGDGLTVGLGFLSTLNTPELVALAGALLYVSVTPNIGIGFFDAYLVAPLSVLLGRRMTEDSVVVGRRIGEGSFGTVYEGTLADGKTDVVVKKTKVEVAGAEEVGEAELYMNRRLSRACPRAVAKYMGTFTTQRVANKGPDTRRWIVWRDQGRSTLGDAMRMRNFPYNLEEAILGKTLDGVDDLVERQARTIRVILRQILENVGDLHGTGVVHRDIKPDNMIVAEKERRIVFIDLGACADLRVGKNYDPNEGLLDPNYCPPERYVMPTSTPEPPPAPVAALLSPALWQLNLPDRFDMYSVGIVLMQLCFAPLRQDGRLVAFNRDLRGCEDLAEWRRKFGNQQSFVEGFEILDANGRAGWDLAQKLLSEQRTKRPPAVGALAHPFVIRGLL